VVASAFANRELHLVLANYSRTVVEVATRQEFVPAGDRAAPPATGWQLPPRSLQILRREPPSAP
jgi:hypothetical protein